jgi:hypothetical protein
MWNSASLFTASMDLLDAVSAATEAAVVAAAGTADKTEFSLRND